MWNNYRLSRKGSEKPRQFNILFALTVLEIVTKSTIEETQEEEKIS